MSANQQLAEKVLNPIAKELGEKDYSEIMEMIKGNPRYIPYNEVFNNKSGKLSLNSNAVELYVEQGRELVPDRYKAMFDVACSMEFRKYKPDKQLKYANDALKLLLERNNFIRKTKDMPIIKYEAYTPDELAAFHNFAETHHRVRNALNMAAMHRAHAVNFVEDLEDMRVKALASDQVSDMKTYQDTFMKISDFYMKHSLIYEEQKRKLDIKKFKSLARINRNMNNKNNGDNAKKVLTISDENYERKEK